MNSCKGVIKDALVCGSVYHDSVYHWSEYSTFAGPAFATAAAINVWDVTVMASEEYIFGQKISEHAQVSFDRQRGFWLFSRRLSTHTYYIGMGLLDVASDHIPDFHFFYDLERALALHISTKSVRFDERPPIE